MSNDCIHGLSKKLNEENISKMDCKKCGIVLVVDEERKNLSDIFTMFASSYRKYGTWKTRNLSKLRILHSNNICAIISFGV